MTVAYQYAQQLQGKTLDGILGTAGGLFVFEVGIDDAKIFAHNTAPFEPQHLTMLGKYHAVAKIRLGPVSLPAFDIITMKPEAKYPRDLHKMRALATRQTKLMNRDEIDEWYATRYPETIIDVKDLLRTKTQKPGGENGTTPNSKKPDNN